MRLRRILRLQRLHGSESDRAGCRFVRGKSRREHACGRTVPVSVKTADRRAKGHLSNLAAGHLLCEILHDNLQEVLLGHLSKENNYEALAFETVACEVTTGDNPYHSGDFHLAVAKRSEVSPLIEV